MHQPTETGNWTERLSTAIWSSGDGQQPKQRSRNYELERHPNTYTTGSEFLSYLYPGRSVEQSDLSTLRVVDNSHYATAVHVTGSVTTRDVIEVVVEREMQQQVSRTGIWNGFHFVGYSAPYNDFFNVFYYSADLML